MDENMTKIFKLVPLFAQMNKVYASPHVRSYFRNHEQLTQLTKTSLLLKKAQEHSVYLDKILNELECQKIEFSSELLYFTDFKRLISKYIDLDRSEDFSILEIIKDKDFTSKIEKCFYQLNLINADKRLIVIKEIFELIRANYLAGAITLLYAQFEGLLTDLLLSNKIIRLNDEKFTYIKTEIFTENFQNGSKREIKHNSEYSGLHCKITIAQHFFPSISQLKIYKIDDMNNTLTKSRNNILHGADLDNFSLERAFILVMWFYFVCREMLKIKKEYEKIITSDH